jgi:hypothetical protein
MWHLLDPADRDKIKDGRYRDITSDCPEGLAGGAAKILISHEVKVLIIGAQKDFPFVFFYLVPFPSVERDCNNHVFLDLLSIHLLGPCVEKGCHCRSLWDIGGHCGRPARWSSGNGTTGLEQGCKGLRTLIVCESQNNLIVVVVGYNPSEDGSTVAIRIVVIRCGAVLSESNDWAEQHRHEESVLAHQGYGHGPQLYRVRTRA